MEFADSLPSIQIVPGDLLVMQVVVTFPFDEVLNTVIADERAENLIQFKAFGIIHNDGVRGWRLVVTREGVRQHLEEFDDQEDWVKAFQ